MKQYKYFILVVYIVLNIMKILENKLVPILGKDYIPTYNLLPKKDILFFYYFSLMKNFLIYL